MDCNLVSAFNKNTVMFNPSCLLRSLDRQLIDQIFFICPLQTVIHGHWSIMAAHSARKQLLQVRSMPLIKNLGRSSGINSMILLPIAFFVLSLRISESSPHNLAACEEHFSTAGTCNSIRSIRLLLLYTFQCPSAIIIYHNQQAVVHHILQRSSVLLLLNCRL